jgi:hypothetical protein
MPFEVAILDILRVPLYQRIDENVFHLHKLGLSKSCIGNALDVDDKTVAKALRWVGGKDSSLVGAQGGTSPPDGRIRPESSV